MKICGNKYRILMNNKRLKTIAFATGLTIITGLGAIPYLNSQNFNYDTKKADDLYKKYCSKCHKNNGEGIKKVYPPIKDADYIKNAGKDELLRGMLFGRSGSVVVNGVKYNGVMTTEVDKSLTDDDIALILQHVYIKYNNINMLVNAKDVQRARKAGKLPPHK